MPKITRKEVERKAGYYQSARQMYGENNLATDRALMAWQEAQETYEKQTGKPMYSRKNPSLQSGYEQFHGHAPRTKRAWNFHCPKGFVILGKAIAIEYRTDKLNGGGDGKSAIYRHEFDDKAVSRNGSTLLLMDERQRKQLYIVGEKLIVTDRGIEH